MKKVLIALLFSSVCFADVRSIDGQKVYGGPRPTDLAQLQKLNIKTVIDLQGGDYSRLGPVVSRFEPDDAPAALALERASVLALRMNWISEPMSSFIIGEPEERSIQHGLLIMHDPDAQPVFVHCKFGHDRTGLLEALYKVFYLGIGVVQAHSEWQKIGHTNYLTAGLDAYFYKVTLAYPR